MSLVLLLLGQAIALALGAGLVSLLVGRGPGARATTIGYGFLLGQVGITLLLRLLSMAGVHWNFAIPALIAGVCAGALFAAGGRWRPGGADASDARVDQGSRVVIGVLMVLIGAHVGLVLYEAAIRPLFPWDATTHWATKARVWYEMRGMVPFVDDVAWIRSTQPVFTDAHPTYPGTVPLFQTWAALAWGSWDDAIVNLSWPLSLAALAAGVFGQLRRLGFVATPALVAAYAVTSLPFVDVHAALAGYADLAVAIEYCFAFLALAAWARSRRMEDAALAVICALALPLLKTPGWIWLATLVPGFACVLMPHRAFRAVAIAAAAAICAVLAYVAMTGRIVVFGYIVELQKASGLGALLENLYVFASWHLLWLFAPLLLVASRRRLIGPNMEPLTVVISAGIAFLLVVFFMSSTSEQGVETYTTINRALLHLAPALVAYCALVLHDLWSANTVPAPGHGPAAA